jgi:Flp pilus assembly protein TadG
MLRPRSDHPFTRLRSRLVREDGVVLVLTAICLLVFLGAAALAIDLGSLYGAQRRAQAAADAAALAASHDVAEASQMNTAGATVTVNEYVARNDPGAAATISYPPGTHNIRVTVNQTAPTFFARIWGQTSENVSASATANANNPAPDAAVFAADTTCGSTNGIFFTGNSTVTIDGSVHSDGSLTFGGAGTQSITGSASYGGPNGCDASPPNTTVAAGGLWRDPSDVPWPKDYTPVAGVCNSGEPWVHSSSSSMTFGGNATTALSGVYCAPSIAFQGSGTYAGNATFIATSGTFSISGNVTFDVAPDTTDLATYLGSGSNLTDLTAMQLGVGTMQINGNSLNAGSFFSPAVGSLIIANGNTSGVLSTCPSGQICNTGYVEGWDIQLNGTSTLAIKGTGPGISGDEGATLLG